MSGQVRLSVVVPAFENGDLLELTLAGLARQSLPVEEFEVVVCDDASSPSLAPLVDKHADQLRLIYVGAERNRGRSANRNAGAARASAPVLLFLDADTVPHRDLLSRHLAFHDGRNGRPGVLLGRRFELDWAGFDALRRGQPLTAAMLDADRDDPRDLHYGLPHQRRDFDRAPWLLGFSHNTSMDKATFDAVGGFDEAMVRWGMEDTELCYRVFHHHGCPPDLFVLSDDAHAYHLPHYRSVNEMMASLDNVKYVTRKHPRFDFEAMHSPAPLGEVMSRVRRYGDSVAACRQAGLGRPGVLPAALREELAGGSALVVGLGVAELELGAGSRTFDHDRPLAEDNWHLLGLMMHHFKTGQFDQLVNIDLWRFFRPDDLNTFVTRGLLKADQIRLVGSHAAPDQAALLPLPFVTDLDSVAQLLASHFTVEVAVESDAAVVTVR